MTAPASRNSPLVKSQGGSPRSCGVPTTGRAPGEPVDADALPDDQDYRDHEHGELGRSPTRPSATIKAVAPPGGCGTFSHTSSDSVRHKVSVTAPIRGRVRWIRLGSTGRPPSGSRPPPKGCEMTRACPGPRCSPGHTSPGHCLMRSRSASPSPAGAHRQGRVPGTVRGATRPTDSKVTERRFSKSTGAPPGTRTPNPRIKSGPLRGSERSACTNSVTACPECTHSTEILLIPAPQSVPRYSRPVPRLHHST
jgi:hypothetical protein